MKLELKHLAPYLPYGLVFNLTRSHNPFTCIGLTVHEDGIMAHRKGGSSNVSLDKYYKPVLRPMSDLTNEMAHKSGYKNANALKLMVISHKIPYIGMDNLFTHHFDVFGLIHAGLAIDINTQPLSLGGLLS